MSTYHELANIAVVKEFYANVMSKKEGFHNYTNYVRGKRISFDVATINSYFRS